MSDRVRDIAPAQFEEELRGGAEVTVIDTRDPDAFAAWHVDPARAPLLNLPEPEIAADLETALGRIPAGARLRVICNAGNASRRVVAALEAYEGEVMSVEGGLIGWSRVLQRDVVPLEGPFTVVQFRREARGCLSYLVASGGQALVVDPAPDVRPYLDEAQRLDVRITRVLDTHVHADHLSGGRDLAVRAGATLHLSRAAVARGLEYADRIVAVEDGDELAIGDQLVGVVALPGHTSDMVGVRIGNEALIGGDSLFADSVARPDLEVGDEGAAQAARLLHRTLHQRILALPERMRLLPCHYASGRLDGPIAPTLAEVRAGVPELSLDEDAFVTQVLGGMPPRPANYLSIIAVNLGDELEADAAARLEIGANNCAARADWACGPGS